MIFLKNLFFLVALCISLSGFSQTFKPSQIKMHWLDKYEIPYTTFSNLKKDFPDLKFITNAGVLNRSLKPTGLYIENGKMINPVKFVQNTKVNYGIHPAGIFYINEAGAHIVAATQHFNHKNVKWAIQGGPMLIINEIINPRTTNTKKAVRNGVGIKKDGTIYFAIMDATYRELARHFQEQGCTNAMTLSDGDGEIWGEGDKKRYHNFGPMISAE
ncbi:MAG: phosphodiester glycosidase family protein [bacterium]|jgi:uncharacterized protein YigE (DUF2233 family)